MWNKPFLSRLFRLALPIMLQSMFTVLGSTITTLMTGQLGDIPLAAIGLTNQLYFILSLAQFGISSGSSIFTAQYWGNKNPKNISKVLGISLFMGLVVGSLFMIIAFFFPLTYLRIFTSDEQVIALGAKLLRILAAGYLFTPISNLYYLVMRSIGNTRLPMQLSIVGILINTSLGFLLIFGKLGLPALGAQGAAYANLIARIIECLLVVFVIYKLKTPLAFKINQLVSFDRPFLKSVLARIIPVTFNEIFWALGISAYSAIFARISTEAIAAISIRSSIEDLLFVPFLGVIHACAILVGNTIGSGNHEQLQDFIKQASRVVLIMGIFFGSLVILGRDFILSLYNITDLTASYGRNIFLILGSILWIKTSNMLYFIGMMRSGGDTRFAYRLDVSAMWLIGVPATLLAAFVFHLPVHIVYLITMTEEIAKYIVAIWRYHSQRWIHSLVST